MRKSRSAYIARGDTREYNVYIETANVESRWPETANDPLTWQLGTMLVSVEILFKILDETLDLDPRRPYVLHRRKHEVIAACICSTLSAIGDVLQDAELALGSTERDVPMGEPSRESAWIAARDKLTRAPGGGLLRCRIQHEIDHVSDILGYGLGLDDASHDASHGPGDGLEDDRPTLAYDAWIRPGEIHALYAPNRLSRYVEDNLFVRAHQVCEGILEAMMVELDGAELAVRAAHYPHMEVRVLAAARLLRPFQDAVRILAELNQFDYAPLRVALRDASGQQSARAQGRKSGPRSLFWMFEELLKSQGLDLLIVLSHPSEYPEEHRALRAFAALGRAVSESMSVHAHIVEATLGVDVLGTLGLQIMSLGEMAAQPHFPTLAKALDKLTLWTSLKYASHSGLVIEEQERAHGVGAKYDLTLPEEPCPPKKMRQTTHAYFDAVRRHDPDEWNGVFSSRPHFEDPKGTKPHISKRQLKIFFKNFMILFPEVHSVSYDIAETGGNWLVVSWNVSADTFMDIAGGREKVDFNGTETFYFLPDGKIAAAFVEWDSAAVADELMRRRREQVREANNPPA